LRFYAALLAERIPSPVGRVARGLLSRVPTPTNDRHWLARAKRFADATGAPLHDRLTRWNALFFDDLEALLRPDFVAGLQPIDKLRHISAQRAMLAGRSTLSQALHANFTSYLADDLLVKTDRCTMANSLEARSPFLDRELVEYAAGLPDSLKLRGGRTKVILREAFADLVPPAIERRGKMGFGVPLDSWLRGPLRDWAEALLDERRLREEGFFHPAEIRRVWHAHLSGKANLQFKLWTVLMFQSWLETQGRSAEAPVACARALAG
jgi:asparagine synthetase B (glutamine-hydrolysing)